jgi:hypothetical protein
LESRQGGARDQRERGLPAAALALALSGGFRVRDRGCPLRDNASTDGHSLAPPLFLSNRYYMGLLPNWGPGSLASVHQAHLESPILVHGLQIAVAGSRAMTSRTSLPAAPTHRARVSRRRWRRRLVLFKAGLLDSAWPPRLLSLSVLGFRPGGAPKSLSSLVFEAR